MITSLREGIGIYRALAAERGKRFSGKQGTSGQEAQHHIFGTTKITFISNVIAATASFQVMPFHIEST